MLEKVISGGQTGADRAGLLAAQGLGIPTGGWCPRGWRTEDGPMPELERFGLRQTTRTDYPTRTRLNVSESCATLIFGSMASRGCKLTQRVCSELRRPVVYIPWHRALPRDALLDAVGPAEIQLRFAKIINIAGNRESTNPGIGGAALLFLSQLFQRLIRNGA